MLMNDLSIIVRQMRVFSERKFQNLNLGFPEQIIIMFLSAHDNVNQDEIAKYFEIDKGAIAKTIQKLEQKELIIRHENSDNRREKIVSLTKSAKETLKQMNLILSEWSTCVYDGISEDDKQKFESIAKIIATNSIKLTKGEKE